MSPYTTHLPTDTVLKKYFLLIRQISAYSGPDLILGAFDSAIAAEAARTEYFKRYCPSGKTASTPRWVRRILEVLQLSRRNPHNDPWHDGGHGDNGLTQDELIILHFDVDGELTFNELSIVSCYWEAMGQTSREVDSVHPNRVAAEERMKQIQGAIERIRAADRMPPNGVGTQTLRVNMLHSDRPQDQPDSYLDFREAQ